MSTATTITSHDTGQQVFLNGRQREAQHPITHTSPNAANRLRTTMAAVKLSFTWLGVRKTLTTHQRAQAAEAFHADRELLTSSRLILDTKNAVAGALQEPDGGATGGAGVVGDLPAWNRSHGMQSSSHQGRSPSGSRDRWTSGQRLESTFCTDGFGISLCACPVSTPYREWDAYTSLQAERTCTRWFATESHAPSPLVREGERYDAESWRHCFSNDPRTTSSPDPLVCDF